MAKTRQKLIKKFVKVTGLSYVCNSLTDFEYEVHTMTGNGNHLNMLKFTLKKL